MRAPTYRDDRNFSGSKPKALENVKVLNVINTEAMFDAREKRNRKRLGEALTSPVDEVSLSVPPIIEKRSLVVEGGIDGMEEGVVSNVTPDKEVGGKGHIVENSYC